MPKTLTKVLIVDLLSRDNLVCNIQSSPTRSKVEVFVSNYRSVTGKLTIELGGVFAEFRCEEPGNYVGLDPVMTPIERDWLHERLDREMIVKIVEKLEN